MTAFCQKSVECCVGVIEFFSMTVNFHSYCNHHLPQVLYYLNVLMVNLSDMSATPPNWNLKGGVGPLVR